MLSLLSLSRPAPAATVPGTVISNTAGVTYRLGDDTRSLTSNTVTLIVAERLDVTIDQPTAPAPGIDDEPATLPVRLTNTGSGNEAFAVVTDAAATLAIDRNADGRFDARIDQPLAGATPVLAPGESVRLLAMAQGEEIVAIQATAMTGSGKPADVFPGAGDGGSDAVIGPTGAMASIGPSSPAVSPGLPTLTKSQTVRAPDGSASPVRGAVVTYTLVARFPAGMTRAARIDDPVPAGTSYVAQSLTLDGEALTDAADADAGGLAQEAIVVALGDVPPAAVHTVTFQVRLP